VTLHSLPSQQPVEATGTSDTLIASGARGGARDLGFGVRGEGMRFEVWVWELGK
jgi:hypothetical protein